MGRDLIGGKLRAELCAGNRLYSSRSVSLIKANVAVLDGAKLGQPLLTFVHVDTTSWAVTRQLLALKELPEVEEIHTVTGESAMLIKVRTRDTRALEDLLARIHSIEGFKGTRSYIALSTYLERGPRPVASDRTT